MKKNDKKDALFDEMFSLQDELHEKIGVLIKAKWDSNTLKLEIEKIYKQFKDIDYEIYLLEKDEDHSHPEALV